jgi:hypothetical protein
MYRALVILLAASLGHAAAFAGDVVEESYLNCDDRAQYIRLAFDPQAKGLWLVRLDERGKPDRRLPPEFRVTEAHVLDVKPLSCYGCFEFRFKLYEGQAYPVMLGRTSIGRRGLVVDLFDIADPSDPEQTWDDVPCYVRR